MDNSITKRGTAAIAAELKAANDARPSYIPRDIASTLDLMEEFAFATAAEHKTLSEEISRLARAPAPAPAPALEPLDNPAAGV